MQIIKEIGAYAGLAGIVGLAVLSALYFSQARDLKRLREWAGRAPERATEQAAARGGGRAPGARAGAASRAGGRGGAKARRTRSRRCDPGHAGRGRGGRALD